MHDESGVIRDLSHRCRLKIFLRGEGAEPIRIFGRHDDRHSLLRLGNRKLGAAETLIFFRHKVEVYIKTVGKLAYRNTHAARSEIVAAFYKCCGLLFSEQALELTLRGRVTLLNLSAAGFYR